MANISDAAGAIYFRANTKETIKELFELIELMDDGSDYYTTYDEWENCNQYIAKINDDYIYQLEIPFSGSGRWSYYCNIENMFKWIRYHIEHYLDDTKKEKYTNMLTSVKNADWEVFFEYVDYEPGCEIFGEYNVSLVHNRQKEEPTVVWLSGEDYELNIVNFAKYLDRTLEEALEEFSYKFENEEEFKEVVEEEKESIENFVGKRWDEIVEGSYILSALYEGTLY